MGHKQHRLKHLIPIFNKRGISVQVNHRGTFARDSPLIKTKIMSLAQTRSVHTFLGHPDANQLHDSAPLGNSKN